MSFEVVRTLDRLVEVADFSSCLEDGRETHPAASGFSSIRSYGLLMLGMFTIRTEGWMGRMATSKKSFFITSTKLRVLAYQNQSKRSLD